MEIETGKETFQVYEEDLIITGDAVANGESATNLCNSVNRSAEPVVGDTDYERVFARYPSDGQGYMQSLAHDDFAGIKETLDRYGFVVVRDIISPEQCARSVDDFFMDINRRAQYYQREPVLRDVPRTWESANFPAQKGKFLLDVPAFTTCAFENRTNPRIYEIYAYLFQRRDLWCNIDNWGLFRGTQDLIMSPDAPEGPELKWDGTVKKVNRPDWRHQLLLHWDWNPWLLRDWLERGEPELFQGLVALVDCPEEVGGFMAVPGSHKHMFTWLNERERPVDTSKSHRLAQDDIMQKHKQKVMLRKGEMVIWYSRTAHCNFANFSPNMRIHQFIRCLPATKESQLKDRYSPRYVAQKFSKDAFTDWKLPYLTDFQKKMVGVLNWREEEKEYKKDEKL